MPEQIRIIERDRSIITELATVLTQDEHKFLQATAIIVPGRRLLNYLHLELTRKLGACIPPKILTIESLGKVLPHVSRRQIAAATQHIIINSLICENIIPCTQPGMEPDIVRFFDEIAEAGFGAEIFDRLTDLLQQNPFYDERHIRQLTAQTKAWQQLYSRYLKFLQEKKLTDRAHDLLERLTACENGVEPGFKQFAEHYFVIGFADATATQIRLLKLLQKNAATEFWLHGDSAALQHALTHKDALSPYSPLAHFVEKLKLQPVFDGQQHSTPHSRIARRLFRISDDVSPVSDVEIQVHKATSPLQEVKAAVATAQNLILKKNIRPENIVIAVPDEAVYGDLLWAICEEAGLPVNYALGIPAVRTQTGQWLYLLLDIFANDAPIAVILDLFNNKLVNPWLQSIDSEIDKNDCIRHLQHITKKHHITNGLNRFEELAHQQKYTDLCQILRVMLDLAKPFTGFTERSLEEWTEVLWSLTEKTGLHEFVQKNPGAYNLENRVLSGWINGLQQFSLAGEFVHLKLTSKNFINLVLQNILNVKIRPAGQPFIGVQVLGMLELRGLSPEAVLVLGNCEGQFPAGPRRELFYSQPLRSKLGLTTTFKLEKLHDQQFFNLLCAAPIIHLFHSSSFNEDPLVRSRYLQRLQLFDEKNVHKIHFRAAQPYLLYGDQLAEEIHPDMSYPNRDDLRELYAQIEKRLDQAGLFPGNRAEVLSHYSYSTLKYLLLCPYRFLLSQLKICDDSLPNAELQATDIGIWLHSVCQFFFTGIADGRLAPHWPDLQKPWHHLISDENMELALLRLQRIAQIYAYKLGDHREDLIFMEDVGWSIFLAHEKGLGHIVPGGNHVEFEREYPLPEISARTGRECSAAIRIDRLVQTPQASIVIDYKKTIPVTKNFEAGKEPQLPFYFHLLQQDATFATEAEWQGQYRDFKSAKPKSFAESRLCTAWENISKKWQARLTDLLENNAGFTAEPSDESCQYCTFSGICRHMERPDVDKPGTTFTDAEPAEA